jgi:hypothetical protein
MRKTSWAGTILVSVLATVFLVSAGHAKDRYPGDTVDRIGKNADRFELQLGVMSYDTGIFTHKLYDGVVINGEVLFPSPGFLSAIGSPRPHLGFDYAAVDDPVHFIYGGLTWDAYLTDRLYVLASLGAGVTTADDLRTRDEGHKALGCRVLFHLGAGLGFDLSEHTTVQLYADHFSNGGLCSPNNGAEAAGVRFGYRF